MYLRILEANRNEARSETEGCARVPTKIKDSLRKKIKK